MPTTTIDCPIDKFIGRVGEAYTLPAVALELLELMDRPRLDAAALKLCVERDPALVAKILRVVNSAVFGLSRRVENLTQAIALLGMRPLKLLVLGFSLPTQIESNVSREALSAYWRFGITRAMAARMLAREHFDLDGDDAFVAALLADLGKLILLEQLGEPFAALDQASRDHGADLPSQSRQSFGFDHFQLTSSLLRQWNLPGALWSTVDALACRVDCKPHDLARQPLARVVVLADLLVEVVERHNLGALPLLTELANAWANIQGQQVKQLVADVEANRLEFGALFDVTFPEQGVAIQALLRAYEHLSQTTEAAMSAEAQEAERMAIELLRNARERAAAAIETEVGAKPQSVRKLPSRNRVDPLADASNRLARDITTAVLHCRGDRCPLSLLLIEGLSTHSFDSQTMVPAALASAMAQFDEHQAMTMLALTPASIAAVVPGIDRHEAKRLAGRFIAHAVELREFGIDRLSIGIAGVETISRGFDPHRLIQHAARCLAAARHSEGHAIKSIEVY